METNNINNTNKKNKDNNNITNINRIIIANKSNNSNKSSKSNETNKTNKTNSIEPTKILNNKNNKINKHLSKFNSLNKRNKYFQDNLIIKERKKYNSISFLSKKKSNSLYFNIKENENGVIHEYSQKLKYQKLTNKINKENIRFNKRLFKRHKSIIQNYFQLFFRYDENKKNEHINLGNSLIKLKRKTKQDITFKDYLKKEDESIESKNESENNEENDERGWEARFKVFKKYINKLKKMSDEEFLKDTLKFIKQEE